MVDALANIPAWAGAALNKLTAHDQAELELLREFYNAFEELQAIPPDKMHKSQQREASLRLVEKAIYVRKFKDPRYGRPGKLTLNGVAVE